ncbi:MAG: hypothetical protein OSB47_00110 [Pirellulaceae bacterium]|nr:hypothetical protein [Pirellulaceae bacterium]
MTIAFQMIECLKNNPSARGQQIQGCQPDHCQQLSAQTTCQKPLQHR